jgi:glutamate--cysteine ligase
MRLLPALRIGTEHEKLAFNMSDNSRMNYDQIAAVLRKLESRFGWTPMIEAGRIIGVTYEGQSVTLEPGGQFELSGAPVENLHQTCAELNSHLYQVRPACSRTTHATPYTGSASLLNPSTHMHMQVKAIGEELGFEFIGLGFDPKWTVDQVPIMPKDRYKLMRAYMPTVGTMGERPRGS